MSPSKPWSWERSVGVYMTVKGFRASATAQPAGVSPGPTAALTQA